jgi:hypothetical protein
MKHATSIALGLVCLGLFSTVVATTLRVARGNDLQSTINIAQDGDTILLAAKTFTATPSQFHDPLCGNCQNAKDGAKATTGFVIKDKGLTIIGADRSGTRLVTGAGYGVYYENSYGSVLENVTVTGGKRDGDGNATDAAVVVRLSKVRIEHCDLRDNKDRFDSVVVGIGGVFGREGAEITADDLNIIGNGWDGIALYRGATAVVTDCVIKDGRGVGIGVTWDATCVAYRNDVSGYWKGIGSFGSSSVIAHNNVVHDNLGWGMVATGTSTMDFANNVVHHNGNCGVAPWSIESRGRIINNIITENGWRDKWVCPCVGVWNYGDWAKWRFSNNIVWGNKAGEYEGIWDQAEINGNLNKDPQFKGNGDYRTMPGSPALHAGDTTVFNSDGSVSHIGISGGPSARPK